MKAGKIGGGIFLVLVSVISAGVFAQSVPGLINYQGRLFDSGGMPVENPALPMRFSLWTQGVTQENVIDEQVLMGGTAAIPLAHQDITPGSEVVTAAGGAPVYETPRDYIMDYANGTITRVEGGFILDGTTVEIDYEWTSYGAELWGETQTVSVSQGLYQVQLGAVNPLSADLFSGSTVYLEVWVNGEVLSPRSPLTSVAFAFVADKLDGLDATAFALSGHVHDFSELTGSVSDSQVPDDITINYALDAGQLGGQPPSSYVSVSGDTVTGDLEVQGRVQLDSDLFVSGNATIMGGHIGLGRAPDSNYGIANDAATAPPYGAFLYGANYGVYARLSSDPNDHYAYLAAPSYGVYGRSGNSDETGAKYGGFFSALSQNLVYGVSGAGYGYSTDTSYGVYGYGVNNYSGPTYGTYGYGYKNTGSGESFGARGFAVNRTSGNAYGGYFTTDSSGTGTHYGVFAAADDYAGWFQNGRVHVGNGGVENHVDGDGDLYVEDELEADGNGWLGGHLTVAGGTTVGGDLKVSGGNIGLGVEPSSSYGIINNSASAPAYGAKLYGNINGLMAHLASDPGDHYAYLATTTDGIYARSGNSDENGIRNGGYFRAESQGTAYGAYGVAYGYSASATYGLYGSGVNNNSGTAYGVYGYGVKSGGHNNAFGVYGYAYNPSSGNAYGGYFWSASSGTGTHYGVYARADDYPLVAVNSYDIYNYYAQLAVPHYGVYANMGSNSDTEYMYGGDFVATSQVLPTGVAGRAYGYGTSSTTGVYGYAANYSGGDARALYGYAYASGGGTAYGLYVAAGTKNWVNPDPEDPEKAIAYVTVEAGENLTYCRGTATLVNGRAEVILPDHFRKVTSPDHPITVQVTPNSAQSLGLAVTYKSNDRIVVEELYNGSGNYQFDYTVQGVRLGYEDYEPVIDNVDYVPFQGNQAGLDESKTTTQEWYDSQPEGLKRIFKKNGILKQDGKVNEELFKQKGWKQVKVKKPKKKNWTKEPQ